MPATAITSMTKMTAVLMAMSGQVLAAFCPATASTDGPRTAVLAVVPMRFPAIISQPVKNPRYGLIAWPTHSKDAPQLAFHRFSRR